MMRENERKKKWEYGIWGFKKISIIVGVHTLKPTHNPRPM